MVTLFSQEKVTEIHDYNLVKDACAEGRAEGRVEGHAEGERNTILRFLGTFSPEQVAAALKVPVEDILRIAEESRS